jgi:hypothetical protein
MTRPFRMSLKIYSIITDTTATFDPGRAIPSKPDDPSVLNSFTILLSKASPSYSLYAFLRNHPLETSAEDGDATELGSLGHLKSAMEAYVEVGPL